MPQSQACRTRVICGARLWLQLWIHLRLVCVRVSTPKCVRVTLSLDTQGVGSFGRSAPDSTVLSEHKS